MTKIAVIGLGYAGIAGGSCFACRARPSIGFFIFDRKRVEELRSGHDGREVAPTDLAQKNLRLDHEPSGLAEADFYIVTVRTPIDGTRRPDLGAVLSASETVGTVLKKGDIVVYEFDRVPGAIEEECLPIFEKKSGLKGGQEFAVGAIRPKGSIRVISSIVLKLSSKWYLRRTRARWISSRTCMVRW